MKSLRAFIREALILEDLTQKTWVPAGERRFKTVQPDMPKADSDFIKNMREGMSWFGRARRGYKQSNPKQTRIQKLKTTWSKIPDSGKWKIAGAAAAGVAIVSAIGYWFYNKEGDAAPTDAETTEAEGKIKSFYNDVNSAISEKSGTIKQNLLRPKSEEEKRSSPSATAIMKDFDVYYNAQSDKIVDFNNLQDTGYEEFFTRFGKEYGFLKPVIDGLINQYSEQDSEKDKVLKIYAVYCLLYSIAYETSEVILMDADYLYSGFTKPGDRTIVQSETKETSQKIDAKFSADAEIKKATAAIEELQE